MYIIIYDFGTSSVKTCLFDIGSEISLVASSTAGYGLYISEDGGAEQDTEEWWAALCRTTKELFVNSDVINREIGGLAFCSQMQGSVFVDKNADAVRPPMNYLDQKGTKEYKECMGTGIIKVSGCSLYKLIRNLIVNYAGFTSAKDPVWKYKWVENNEPDVYKKIYKWLDIGDYLVARCTGRIVRTADSTFATFLYDTRKGKEGWNRWLLKMYKVNPEHMPEIIDCTELVGGLTKKAAKELGLIEGIPVYGGGGDTTFVNIGAGCTKPGDTHIYVGTSGWVSTYLDYQTVDIDAMITGVLSAKHGYFNFYAELETAGKCFEWVMNHLALDEVGVYLDQTRIRAVLEGICYHLRWLLECEMRKVKTSDTIRFVGGGALSPVTCQMLSDITGFTIETVGNSQEVGAVGTALVVAVGIKKADVLELSRELIKTEQVYIPNPENKEVYDRNYKVFKKLYRANALNFRGLNAYNGGHQTKNSGNR